MARKPNGKAGANAWQWSRTAQTRRALLEAARAVFTEHGFAEASVADVVSRAGSSVGSLYHHFGGKSELFLALWADHRNAHEEAAQTAVAVARKNGESDPLELFVAGARGYLDTSWQRRDLVRMLMDGDAPPGFELMRRTSDREWVRQNAVLLGASSAPADRLVVSVLTSVMGSAAREVATSGTKRDADEVIEAAVRLIRQFGPVLGGEA
ncbi:MAG: TetR family transcriptional regulator [Streptosporangiales bacterium]|nr:TetR family transcriptional regulator [Streptosporangiales bacterium]